MSSLNCIAQVFTAPVYGKILDSNHKPLNNIKVKFLKNNTILESTLTDSTGHFQFRATFQNKNKYSIIVECYDRNDFPEVIRSTDDTNRVESYHFEFTCNGISQNEENHKNIYFDLHSIKDSMNINAEYYNSLLEEYPDLCLEFRQIINPKEDITTAKARFHYFKSQLEKVGCDMDRINFSFNIEYLDDEQLISDDRSRIVEYIVSNDGKCN